MYSVPRTAPEMTNKSSFAQTCNRLSRFLKERRSLGDFASVQNMSSSMLDISGNKEMYSGPINATMNLFPKTMGEEDKLPITGENIKSLELFPLTRSSTTVNTTDDSRIIAGDRDVPKSQEETKANAAKMTIFYAGQVLVFDDLPEDKAEEIMSLASQLGTTSMSSEAQPLSTKTFTNQPSQGSILEQPASPSDLPIARRVSLHRFMEKRKHRIESASPYQVHRNADKYELMKHLLQKQHKQELELKLF